MDLSLIIPSFERAYLLKWNLDTLVFWTFTGEVLVINDGSNDETEALCEQYRSRLNIRYVFSGSRNVDRLVWRIPGFALNIGLKKASCSNVVLCCAEIYHVAPFFSEAVAQLVRDPKVYCTPQVGYDDTGDILTYIQERRVIENDLAVFQRFAPRKLNMKLPFCMAFRKESLMEIGGYDEDFIGIGYDDDDLIQRVEKIGLSLVKIPGAVIHLFHGRKARHRFLDKAEALARTEFNKRLLETKRFASPIRNQNRVWGESY